MNQFFDFSFLFFFFFRENVLRYPNNSYRWNREFLGGNGYINESNMRGGKRILCIIKALKVLEVKRCGHSFKLQEHVNCIRMYFRAVAEPFISKKDVEEFLRFYYRNRISEDLIESLGEDYECLFKPESSMAYTPRSLKHLSRLRVRKSLQWKVTVLPNAVKGFLIPPTLMEFLKCNT